MAVNYTKMTSKGGGQPFQRLETASKNPVFIDLEEKKPKNNIPSSGNSNNRGKSTSFENTTPKSNDYYKSTFSPAGRIKETFTSVSNSSGNTSMNTPAVNDRLKLGHGPISVDRYIKLISQQNKQSNSFLPGLNTPKREEKFLPAYEPKRSTTERELHQDFAAIADNIYDATVGRNSTGIKAYEKCEPIPGITWRMVDGEYGNVTMKVGVYTRERLEGQPEEFVVAFMGTNNNFRGIVESIQTVGAWTNNILQNFSPLSADMWEAIIYAHQFVKAHPDAKITFVGHSKGGAEALMAAVATDKDAVVFNPAYPNFGSYALNPYSYKGKAVSYVVRGEFLNVIAGEPNVGEVRYIGEYWKKDDDEKGEEAKTEAFGDHRMGVIKNLLRREKNVKIQ